MTITGTPPRTPRLARRLVRPGSIVVRAVFAVALLMQLAARVAVPALHAGVSRPLDAHLDLPGSQHHAHDEASCATCVAGDGPGRVERPAVVLPLVLVAVVAAASYDERVLATRVDSTSAPRAPPAIA